MVKKMEMTGAKAYLVNTGWNGTGKRISIKRYKRYHRCYPGRFYRQSSDKSYTRTSISLYRQNCRVLIRRSWIRVILMLTLLSGMKKQKTWLAVSSRTSLSSLVTKLVRSWLLLVRNCNNIHNDYIKRRCVVIHDAPPFFSLAVKSWLISLSCEFFEDFFDLCVPCI